VERTNKKVIAVVGATRRRRSTRTASRQSIQGTRLTRNPAKHSELADEVIQADLNRPETLAAAFEGAHRVFLVTNFGEEGIDEVEQATAVVGAAKNAGVKHVVCPRCLMIRKPGFFHYPINLGLAGKMRNVKLASADCFYIREPILSWGKAKHSALRVYFGSVTCRVSFACSPSVRTCLRPEGQSTST
jgi:hypothetical protein